MRKQEQEVFGIPELTEKGYQRSDLYRIAHSEDFAQAGGFRAPGKKTSILFHKKELDLYLRRRNTWQ